MPAIQPALLKKQIEDLLQYYDSPPAFVTHLKELFDFYADRTLRPGGQHFQLPLIRFFNIPRQVSRQIDLALQTCLSSQPEQGILLADLLWQEPWLECRLLAFQILGWLLPGPSRDVGDRLRTWCRKCGYDPVMDSSLARGTVQIWKRSPSLLLDYLESWLESSDQAHKRWGLRVIEALVSDPAFDNLPVVFRLLTPFVQSMGTVPDADLLAAVQALAQRSSQETAFFLQRNLTNTGNPGIFVLIRLSLDRFAPLSQQDLRAFLRQMRDQFNEL
jgi:hypothetical protein